MTIEVRVPQLPESVADATLVAWHKKPGDAVNRDENLVDLETDKVVLEVPAPATGVLRELKVQNGAVVTSGQVLALLDEGVAAGASTPAAATVPPWQQGVGSCRARPSDTGTASGRAGECLGRRPWRAQGPDDASAGAHCRATRAGAGDRRHADDVQ